MAAWCRCRCHNAPRANLHEAKQRGNDVAVEYWRHDPSLGVPPMVDLHSQLEALVAQGCGCMRFHVRLPLPRPKYLPPRSWNPNDGEGSE